MPKGVAWVVLGNHGLAAARERVVEAFRQVGLGVPDSFKEAVNLAGRVQAAKGQTGQATAAGVGQVHHVAQGSVGRAVVGEAAGRLVLHFQDEGQPARTQVELPCHVRAVDQRGVAVGVGVVEAPMAAVEVALRREHVLANPAADGGGGLGVS